MKYGMHREYFEIVEQLAEDLANYERETKQFLTDPEVMALFRKTSPEERT